mgnify:CR=1 FL=1
MKILNVEIGELDIFDLEVAEQYEKSLAEIQNKDYNLETLSEIIKAQCTDVMNLFNELFGEGTDKKIFGNKTNLKLCLQAFEELVENVNRQGEELSNSVVNKYSNTRTKR